MTSILSLLNSYRKVLGYETTNTIVTTSTSSNNAIDINSTDEDKCSKADDSIALDWDFDYLSFYKECKDNNGVAPYSPSGLTLASSSNVTIDSFDRSSAISEIINTIQYKLYDYKIDSVSISELYTEENLQKLNDVQLDDLKSFLNNIVKNKGNNEKGTIQASDETSLKSFMVQIELYDYAIELMSRTITRLESLGQNGNAISLKQIQDQFINKEISVSKVITELNKYDVDTSGLSATKLKNTTFNSNCIKVDEAINDTQKITILKTTLSAMSGSDIKLLINQYCSHHTNLDDVYSNLMQDNYSDYVTSQQNFISLINRQNGSQIHFTKKLDDFNKDDFNEALASLKDAINAYNSSDKGSSAQNTLINAIKNSGITFTTSDCDQIVEIYNALNKKLENKEQLSTAESNLLDKARLKVPIDSSNAIEYAIKFKRIINEIDDYAIKNNFIRQNDDGTYTITDSTYKANLKQYLNRMGLMQYDFCEIGSNIDAVITYIYQNKDKYDNFIENLQQYEPSAQNIKQQSQKTLSEYKKEVDQLKEKFYTLVKAFEDIDYAFYLQLNYLYNQINFMDPNTSDVTKIADQVQHYRLNTVEINADKRREIEQAKTVLNTYTEDILNITYKKDLYEISKQLYDDNKTQETLGLNNSIIYADSYKFINDINKNFGFKDIEDGSNAKSLKVDILFKKLLETYKDNELKTLVTNGLKTGSYKGYSASKIKEAMNDILTGTTGDAKLDQIAIMANEYASELEQGNDLKSISLMKIKDSSKIDMYIMMLAKYV